MQENRVPTGLKLLFIPAAICLAAAVYLGVNIGANEMAKGYGSVGDKWYYWLYTLLGGAGTFSLPALLMLIWNKIQPFLKGWRDPDPVENLVAPNAVTPVGLPLNELQGLFTVVVALARDPKNQELRRKFWLALAMVALALETEKDYIKGFSGTVDNGEVIIRYRLMPEPPAPLPQSDVSPVSASGFIPRA